MPSHQSSPDVPPRPSPPFTPYLHSSSFLLLTSCLLLLLVVEPYELCCCVVELDHVLERDQRLDCFAAGLEHLPWLALSTLCSWVTENLHRVLKSSWGLRKDTCSKTRCITHLIRPPPPVSSSSYELLTCVHFNTRALCSLVCRPPRHSQDFREDFTDYEAGPAVNCDRFNTHVCCESRPLASDSQNLIDPFNRTQAVSDPTRGVSGRRWMMLLTFLPPDRSRRLAWRAAALSQQREHGLRTPLAPHGAPANGQRVSYRSIRKPLKLQKVRFRYQHWFP